MNERTENVIRARLQERNVVLVPWVLAQSRIEDRSSNLLSSRTHCMECGIIWIWLTFGIENTMELAPLQTVNQTPETGDSHQWNWEWEISTHAIHPMRLTHRRGNRLQWRNSKFCAMHSPRHAVKVGSVSLRRPIKLYSSIAILEFLQVADFYYTNADQEMYELS
jgi:hypothetical protein